VSRSLNKVTLIGNLGADPEVRSTSGGNRVATFSLATSRSWNGPSGDKQEKTEWHRCVVWNSKVSQLADIVERYLKKGDKVFVEGRIEYRQWQDKENQTRYMTEINVREMIMLSGRAGGADGMDGEAPARSRASSDRSRGAVAGSSAGSGGAAPSGEFEDFKGSLEEEDDDLPF
jgi:single-strand DNA-binding protein